MKNINNLIELTELFDNSKTNHAKYMFSKNGNVEIWWNDAVKANSNSYKACGDLKRYKGTFKSFVLLPFETTYYNAIKIAKSIVFDNCNDWRLPDIDETIFIMQLWRTNAELSSGVKEISGLPPWSYNSESRKVKQCVDCLRDDLITVDACSINNTKYILLVR